MSGLAVLGYMFKILSLTRCVQDLYLTPSLQHASFLTLMLLPLWAKQILFRLVCEFLQMQREMSYEEHRAFNNENYNQYDRESKQEYNIKNQLGSVI